MESFLGAYRRGEILRAGLINTTELVEKVEKSRKTLEDKI